MEENVVEGIDLKSPRTLGDIDPTVFIALGGAGGHVLGRVRRIFQEEFADELDGGGASPLQFLLLDADDFDKLPEEVKANLPDREDDFLSLSHFNPNRYARRQLEIPDSDLHRWFDRRALRFLEDGIIRDGASRLRMLGRLCLHYSYREVEQRIRAKLQKAADADVHRTLTRVRPEPRPLRVFIIASSCGGTGSAAFLDVAAMVNRIARERGTTPSVTGFVFLPFPFIEANAQIDSALEAFYQHNAWAFFEELNHLLLHPERVSEFVLDLDRPDGRPPRAHGFTGELFRTIYLLNDQIPTVGRMYFPQMYAYTAKGIFDLFLAPDEGTIQSHYSNIKTKLGETDRIHGQLKRFATFGYAEYRLRTGSLAEALATRAVERTWANLTSSPEKEGAEAAAAAQLGDLVDRTVQKIRHQACDWALPIGNAAKHVTEARGTEALQGIASGRFTFAQNAWEARRAELPGPAEVLGALQGEIAAALDARLEWPPLGVQREIGVLEGLRARIRGQAEALRVDKPGALTVDPEIVTAQGNVSALAGRIGRRGRWGIRRAADAVSKPDFIIEMESYFKTLRTAVDQRQEAEIRLRIAAVLDEIARDGGWLSGRVEALRKLTEALNRPERGRAGEGFSEAIPTVRLFPSDEEVAREAAARLERTRSEVGRVVEQAERECWKRFVEAPGEHTPQGAARLHRDLRRVWRTEIETLPELASTREMRDPLAAGAPREAGEHLRELVAMSHPACPVERTGLHPADTIAQIPSVTWPWSVEHKGRVLKTLGITFDAGVARSGERKKRVSVLQAWYGFASRALEGMEALRRSYLERHRGTSLPHIHAAWNDRGVGCAAEGLVRLSDEDVLLAARALAISYRPATAQAATAHAGETPVSGAAPGGDASVGQRIALPGIRIVRDPRDAAPFYLVMYDQTGGRTTLRWRDVRPVSGHRQTWEMVYGDAPASAGCGGVESGVLAPAGLDLERDLVAYLGSEVRPRHAEFLAGLDRLERASAENEAYLETYRAYLAHLEALVRKEEERGRELHLPILRRLVDALHRHVRGLTLDESIPL
ncbi:tubulin-like doman-containing protein [Longimicrobium sp.]|uniref:tubulin-like doman-containing protein n=1 Tax=Longimicrobium sp. TaxID=2029185 RepID=UPI002E330BD4|nr:tubulin-like doman-containing protein [Longimicrobium sp.]HEX6040232.1 tubulin-like doman-containing protein [Longimicrobium sp.]